ncbi:MAG: transposase [Bacteroidales bacterium]|nr:transposase [Bacteroidales bacterium]
MHRARIITYADIKKSRLRLIRFLTNDMDIDAEEIVAIYRQRWEIELLFKQLKQNFPLRYFYGESTNAIKILIWVTLMENLLLMVVQRRVSRPWSFSELATIVQIMLMYYVNIYSFLEDPEKDWAKIIAENEQPTSQPPLFDL